MPITERIGELQTQKKNASDEEREQRKRLEGKYLPELSQAMEKMRPLFGSLLSVSVIDMIEEITGKSLTYPELNERGVDDRSSRRQEIEPRNWRPVVAIPQLTENGWDTDTIHVAITREVLIQSSLSMGMEVVDIKLNSDAVLSISGNETTFSDNLALDRSRNAEIEDGLARAIVDPRFIPAIGLVFGNFVQR